MHPNEELVRAEAAAWDTGDPEAVAAFYTPQTVCDIRGNGPLAGEYRGHEGMHSLATAAASIRDLRSAA